MLDKSFEPAAVEERWYRRWESAGWFAHGDPRSSEGQPAYCIQLPPPNVTGTLHMGHAFQQTLMDALIRYHRMRGFNTNWVVGTDHAGIATQIVVERQLEEQGQTRHDLGRDKFVERVWQWKQQSGATIMRQMRRLGASANWTYADTEGQKAGYFTMDTGWYIMYSQVWFGGGAALNGLCLMAALAHPGVVAVLTTITRSRMRPRAPGTPGASCRRPPSRQTSAADPAAP